MSLRRAILVWLLLSVLALLLPRDTELACFGWPLLVLDRYPVKWAWAGGVPASQLPIALNDVVLDYEFSWRGLLLRLTANEVLAISWWGALGNACGAAAVTAVIAGVLHARSRRRAAGAGGPTCTACGYLLVGNTSGCCPECGTPVQAQESEPGP